MGLPRTFVGFSSTDENYYWLMKAWKANSKIDFDFADCQLADELNSDDEAYVKRVCRRRIDMAGTFVLLIGDDTRYKYRYVRWEAQVALEKGCRIIGVNLDGARAMVRETCPPVIRDVGAVFVPFSPRIIAHTLEHFEARETGNWHYRDDVYLQLGY